MTSDSDPKSTSNTDTGGAAHVGGNVDAGNDFVGRDKLTEQNTTNDSSVKIALATDGSTISNSTITIGSIYQNAPSSPAILESEAPAPGESPYRGMEYFDEKDADRFFGREQLTAELVEYLRHNHLLAIVGASGSGKSSLARAGLIPALKGTQPLIDGSQPPKGGSRWLYVDPMTPTAHPLKSIAGKLTKGVESTSAQQTLMDDMLRDHRSLDLYAHRLVNGDQRLLLLVDQFEELFTLCKDENEQKAFVNNLLHAAQADGVVTLVLTLRADFYHHCARFPELRNALERQQKYIGSMSRDELRRAIEEPAKAGKWEFQEGLVEQLLNDVGDEPGALPLLSHALLESWKRRQGRTMTLAGYVASGRVQGAIAKSADAICNAFDEAQQRIARTIFLRLTELGEGSQDTRRRVRPAELNLTHASNDEVQNVLKTLADARLVTTGENEVQVAHEALIRAWQTLRGWLDDDREGNRIQRRLTEAANQWLEYGKDANLLYRGVLLQQAQEWLTSTIDPPNQIEMEYLQESQKFLLEEQAERERNLRFRWFAWSIAAIALIAIVATIYSLGQTQLARTDRNQAEIARATADAAKIQAEQEATRAKEAQAKAEVLSVYVHADLLQKESILVRDSDPQLALLLGIESLRIQDSRGEPHATDAALHLLTGLQVAGLPLVGHTAPVLDVEFSPDGHWLASASDDATVRLWDATDFEKPAIVLTGHSGGVNSVAFSADGQMLASGSKDGTIRLWSIGSPENSSEILLQGIGEIYDLAFSTDGRWLASVSADGLIRLWEQDPLESEPTILFSDQVQPKSLAFSWDNRWLGGGGKNIAVWEIKSLATSPIVRNVDDVNKLTFFHVDGANLTILASFSINSLNVAHILLWEMDNWQAEPTEFLQEESIFNAVAFGEDLQIALASDNLVKSGDVRISFDPTNGSNYVDLVGVFDNSGYGHTHKITTLAYAPYNKWLASGSNDFTIRIWGGELPQEDPAKVKFFPETGARRFEFPPTCIKISKDSNCTYGSPTNDLIGCSCSPGYAKTTHQRRVDILKLSCQRVDRNLTQEEWDRYFPGEKYRQTCQEWSS